MARREPTPRPSASRPEPSTRPSTPSRAEPQGAGRGAAKFYTLFESARVTDRDPEAYLRYTANTALEGGQPLPPHEWEIQDWGGALGNVIRDPVRRTVQHLPRLHAWGRMRWPVGV